MYCFKDNVAVNIQGRICKDLGDLIAHGGAIVAKHEDLGIEIKIKTFRSMQKNKELSKTVIELIIDELIN